MINIDSISTNESQVIVWDLNGYSNQVNIAPMGHAQVPGIWLGGQSYYGGMKCNATLLIHDGPSGAIEDLLFTGSDLEYFFQGASAALTVFGVLFVVWVIKRGLRVSSDSFSD